MIQYNLFCQNNFDKYSFESSQLKKNKNGNDQGSLK